MSADTLQMALGILLLPVLLLEILLATRWSATYFSLGVPLFCARVSAPGSLGLDRVEEDLNLEFERRLWQPLIFRRVEAQTVGFRERFWPPVFFSYYVPLMHGRVRQPPGGGMQVQGRSNWALPLILVLIGIGAYKQAPELAGIWTLFVGVNYGLQVRRFREVVRIIRSVGSEAA